LDLDPLAAALGVDEREPALAAREERAGDVGEVARDGLEGLGEPRVDGLGQLGAQLLELGEAALDVLALLDEAVQALLLALLVGLRERVDLAELLAAAFEALRALGEGVAVVALRRLGVDLGEATAGVGEAGAEAGVSDLRGGGALARLGRL